jgi:hypothetical protein
MLAAAMTAASAAAWAPLFPGARLPGVGLDIPGDVDPPVTLASLEAPPIPVAPATNPGLPIPLLPPLLLLLVGPIPCWSVL